ncbi:MAG: enoyl-CoA hydratase [Ignavibacteria bacterium]|nr:enoyl-CoA hydratase [Ignavibacteria bacterium]
MNYTSIIYEKKEHTAFVILNRPDKLNALDNHLLNELKDVFTVIAHDDEIYTVIITGKDERSFAAGADINELNQLNVLSGKKITELGQTVFNQIENLGKPVIAAINGYALGGGCELALACHIRVASENAVFGQPEINLGTIPAYGGTQRLAKLINCGRALEYILTGDCIPAQEAYRIGLVNKLCNPEDVLTEAEKIANKIVSKGQVAVKMSLKAVLSGFNLPPNEGQHVEASLFAVCCGTEDFKEGTSAFLEKRQPVFKNK